jgi:hypothetical protein
MLPTDEKDENDEPHRGAFSSGLQRLHISGRSTYPDRRFIKPGVGASGSTPPRHNQDQKL